MAGSCTATPGSAGPAGKIDCTVAAVTLFLGGAWLAAACSAEADCASLAQQDCEVPLAALVAYCL